MSDVEVYTSLLLTDCLSPYIFYRVKAPRLTQAVLKLHHAYNRSDVEVYISLLLPDSQPIYIYTLVEALILQAILASAPLDYLLSPYQTLSAHIYPLVKALIWSGHSRI